MDILNKGVFKVSVLKECKFKILSVVFAALGGICLVNGIATLIR